MQDMKTEALKETLKVRPPCGVTGGQKYFMGSPRGKYLTKSGKCLTFSEDIGLWEIPVPKEFWIRGEFTSSKTSKIRKSLNLLQIVLLKTYFDSLPLTKKGMMICSQYIIQFCHTDI
jgi:hypothetical protein